MENDLLTPEDLAHRWKVTIVTISQWRWNGKGPRFLNRGARFFITQKMFSAMKNKKAEGVHRTSQKNILKPRPINSKWAKNKGD